jgi:hypothetical protein
MNDYARNIGLGLSSNSSTLTILGKYSLDHCYFKKVGTQNCSVRIQNRGLTLRSRQGHSYQKLGESEVDRDTKKERIVLEKVGTGIRIY